MSSANNKTETLVVSVLLCPETGREPTGVGEKGQRSEGTERRNEAKSRKQMPNVAFSPNP